MNEYFVYQFAFLIRKHMSSSHPRHIACRNLSHVLRRRHACFTWQVSAVDVPRHCQPLFLGGLEYTHLYIYISVL